MFCTKCGNEMPDGSKFCTKRDATAEPYALVCIQDGKFLGAIDAPANLADYPNSGMYSA